MLGLFFVVVVVVVVVLIEKKDGGKVETDDRWHTRTWGKIRVQVEVMIRRIICSTRVLRSFAITFDTKIVTLKSTQ